MIAHKSHRANAVPQSPEARLEIVKAIHALATQDKDERLRQRRAELILIRRELRQIALALHELKCACDPRRRSYVIKYSPDQPRVPAGNPDGGNGQVVAKAPPVMNQLKELPFDKQTWRTRRITISRPNRSAGKSMPKAWRAFG